MIERLNLNKVASYKSLQTLETDKKVNLIYGLNGTGKSTISNYLYNTDDSKYLNCSIENLDEEDEILVYNQKFIQENFFEAESQSGIFTLSKANSDAEKNISAAQEKIDSLKKKIKSQEERLGKEVADLSRVENETIDKVWEIKVEYTGGDRVLEYCFKGLKSGKSKLLNHLTAIQKHKEKPERELDVIKKEVQALEENSTKIDYVPKIEFKSFLIEQNKIFKKEIVGNENSSVADFISKLGNSDWVKSGLKYIPEEISESKETCPFCQENTISKELISNIKSYFDEAYEKDLQTLNQFKSEYNNSFQSIPSKSVYEANPKFEDYEKDFHLIYDKLVSIIRENLQLIQIKINSPSKPISLNPTDSSLEKLNQLIKSINSSSEEHNEKLKNKQDSLDKLKSEFWELMRFDYDQTISLFLDNKKRISENLKTIGEDIESIEKDIKKEENIIIEEQKKTVNVEKAIGDINKGLIDLGIEDFKISKFTDALYKVVRQETDSTVFKSLSEGEKMIISFLYFLELCKGKKSAEEGSKNKIIVIDDPISSLSHIYIFNIGRLIHQEFLRTDKYEQIFILTHSLYFFYELTDTNSTRRKENQKLFRLRKNSNGTVILEMKYDEIQNDYQSYWQVVKDERQPPALIANCMRNIIEYFFNFVEKNDLNNVFQKKAMQEIRFQSFNRYINRESHSLGQNIFDIKEFNYEDFRDAFKLVFVENNYEDHFKRMMN